MEDKVTPPVSLVRKNDRIPLADLAVTIAPELLRILPPPDGTRVPVAAFNASL